jgi:hypothetical protein
MQNTFFGLLFSIEKKAEETCENTFFQNIEKKTPVKAIALRFLVGMYKDHN